MKLFALIVLLLLLGCSGAATQTIYLKAATVIPDNAGILVGVWALMIIHIVAACVLTAMYIDTGERK